MSEQPHGQGPYKVKGKKGTIVRAGIETDTAEVCVLKCNQIVHAVAEATNAKGDTRLRICRPVSGWLSLKTVVEAKVASFAKPAPKRRTPGPGATGDWPELSVPVAQVDTTQRFVNLFGSGPTRKLQYSAMPRHFVAAEDGGKRVYFDSLGGIVPSPPSDVKAPTVGPRCADPLPEVDREQVKDVYPERFVFTDKSTPANYKDAALRGSCGPPAPPGGGAACLIADDDPLYAALWAPAPGGAGLPRLTKHVFDPWTRSFLRTGECFVNGGGEAVALRGVDMRSFYDESKKTLKGVVNFGPEAQGARSLTWILDLVHGGCIETVLHEAMVEALKCTEDSEAVLVDFRAEIRVPHVQGQTYAFEAVCKLPEKTDDDDDDEDFDTMVTFSDSGISRDPDAEDVEMFLFASVNAFDADGQLVSKAKAKAIKGKFLRLYFANDCRGPAGRFVVDGPLALPVHDYPEPEDPLRYAKRAVPDGVKAVAGNVHAKALEPEPKPDPSILEAYPSTCERYKDAALLHGDPRTKTLFPPDDASHERLRTSETHDVWIKQIWNAWSGDVDKSEHVWTTGQEAALQRGIDFRHFYNKATGVLEGVVRFSEKALEAQTIADAAKAGVYAVDVVHPGALHSVLDEGTAELMKLTDDPNMSTRKFVHKLLPFRAVAGETYVVKIELTKGGGGTGSANLSTDAKGTISDLNGVVIAEGTTNMARLTAFNKTRKDKPEAGAPLMPYLWCQGPGGVDPATQD